MESKKCNEISPPKEDRDDIVPSSGCNLLNLRIATILFYHPPVTRQWVVVFLAANSKTYVHVDDEERNWKDRSGLWRIGHSHMNEPVCCSFSFDYVA